MRHVRAYWWLSLLLMGAGCYSVPVVSRPDQPPQVVHRVAPVYPPAARSRGAQGDVIMNVLVDQVGRASRVEVIRVSGHPAFGPAARSAMSRWRFRPAVHRGRRVRTWVRQRMSFRLR